MVESVLGGQVALPVVMWRGQESKKIAQTRASAESAEITLPQTSPSPEVFSYRNAGFFLRFFLKKEKAGSTPGCSQWVPHTSTNRALCHLTSEVERDPVHLTRYGRQR